MGAIFVIVCKVSGVLSTSRTLLPAPNTLGSMDLLTRKRLRLSVVLREASPFSRRCVPTATFLAQAGARTG